ncbi:hypothetical protein PV08_01904 [Exophiala spinifera]|uniref:Uncharacterized protein n=1 Tax=Exophiala spinifera TaxID=91928 RepID=A0A0D2CCU5_9EURO|nr:uncharacterized protein PV08_01904 [Exophiala spinifera]KIW21324.1 hypothetical protein PV08_01904 [Exophiala spinifera]
MDKLRFSPYVDVFWVRAEELIASLPSTASKQPSLPEKETSGPKPFDMNMQILLKYLKEVEKAYERSKVQEARQKVHKFRMIIKSLQQLAHKRPELFMEKEPLAFNLSPMTDTTSNAEEHQQFTANTPTKVNGASTITTPETPDNKAVGSGGPQDDNENPTNGQDTPPFRSIIPMRSAKRQPSYLDQVQPMVVRDTPYTGKFAFAPVHDSLSTCFEFGAQGDSPSKSKDQEVLLTASQGQAGPVFTIEEELGHSDSGEEKAHEHPINKQSMSDPTGHGADSSKGKGVPDNSQETCDNISLKQEYTLGHVFMWCQDPVPNGDENVLVNDQTALPDSSHMSCGNAAVDQEYTLGHVFAWSEQPVPNGDEEDLAPVCDSTEQHPRDRNSCLLYECSTLKHDEDSVLGKEVATIPPAVTSVELTTRDEQTSQPSVEDPLGTETILSTPAPAATSATNSTPKTYAAHDNSTGAPENNQVVKDETYLSTNSPGHNGTGVHEVAGSSDLEALFNPSDAEEYLAKALSDNGMLEDHGMIVEDAPLLDNCTVKELHDVEEETLLMATQAFLPRSPVVVNTVGVAAADNHDTLSDSDDSLIIITEEAPIEEIEESPAAGIAPTVTHQSSFTSTAEEYTLRHVFPHTGDQAPPEGDTVSSADDGIHETPNSPAASAGSTLLDDQSPKTVKFEDFQAVSTACPDLEEVIEDGASDICLQVETGPVPNHSSSTSDRNEVVTVQDVSKEPIIDIGEIITRVVSEDTEASLAESSIADSANLELDVTEEVANALHVPLQKSVDETDVLMKDKEQSSCFTHEPTTQHVCTTLACTTVASLLVGLKSPAAAAFMLYAGIAYAKYKLYH